MQRPVGDCFGRSARLALGAVDEYASDVMVQAHLSVSLLRKAPAAPASRSSWLAGRVLLARLLNQGLLPPLPIAPSGKPLPVSPSMPAFSISHSGGHVAVLLGPDSQPVGCDIERLRPRRGLMDIAHHYFSPSEIAHLEQLGHLGSCASHRVIATEGGVDAQTAAFWEFWTLREAILKRQGRSVWEMADIELMPQPPYSDRYAVQHWSKQGVSIACCVSRPTEVVIEPLTYT